MKPFAKIIEENIKEFHRKDYIKKIDVIDIDSFDLVVLRVAMEKEMGREFEESEWLKFNTLMEIKEYYDNLSGEEDFG